MQQIPPGSGADQHGIGKCKYRLAYTQNGQSSFAGFTNGRRLGESNFSYALTPPQFGLQIRSFGHWKLTCPAQSPYSVPPFFNLDPPQKRKP
jgi:hypothetical protein